MWACRRVCGVTWDPQTQGGSLALHHYHQAMCHLCIVGMVAWLSDSQCQEETKQDPKISMLMDNRSYVHHSHQYDGSTYLYPPTGVSGSE